MIRESTVKALHQLDYKQKFLPNEAITFHFASAAAEMKISLKSMSRQMNILRVSGNFVFQQTSSKQIQFPTKVIPVS